MELTEHDFIQDEVGEEEMNLAQELRDLCDSGGKEKEGTKLKAASIFYKLAKVYKLKTNHKKLNMIRSAALYNAAIVRDPENQIIKDELKALCSVVLVKAQARKFGADLISLALTMKTILQAFRKYFGENFNQLEKIPDNVKGDQLTELQRKKILDVKNCQNTVTRRYTELMRFISDECIKIMGAPPCKCKYAVVGLGSLARSEITLYSDFEHIIVLDNDVAKMEMEEQNMIMKYFRWFTTIFNIILINLGETMINCVAIPSINPRYRDWFMDHVTPNGVTYDGMVAHACIRPLGRPETKEKKKTEFIKPVDEMLEYSDSDEGKDQKQGYHVAEALSKACFVAGDEAIYAEYQEKAYLRVTKSDKKNNFLTVFKQIEENLENFNIADQQSYAALGMQNYNIKRAIYRGATIFISAIGRLHSLQASSCFDVIDKLNQIGKLSDHAARRLQFMVAVACEVRAKVYHSKGQQDNDFMEGYAHKDLTEGLIKFVGKHSLVSSMEAIIFMQQTLKRYKADLDMQMILLEGFVAEEHIELKKIALDFLGLNKEVEKLNKQAHSSSQIDTFPISIFEVEATFQHKKYDLAIDLCSKINQDNFTVDQKFQCIIYELASIVNQSHNQETQSFECLRSEVEDNVQEMENKLEIVEPESTSNSLQTYSDTLMLLEDNKVPNTSNVQTLRQQILEYDTMDDKIKAEMLCAHANIMIKNGHYTKAMELLDKVKQMMQPYKNTTTVVHMQLYNVYAVCYRNTGRYYEAFICGLEYARICNKLKQPIPDVTKKMTIQTIQRFIFRHPKKLCESAKTLTINGKYTEALKLLDEAKQMMQPYKNTTTVSDRLLYIAYAGCYLNTLMGNQQMH